MNKKRNNNINTSVKKKYFFIAVTIAFSLLFTFVVFADGEDPLTTINNLSTFVFSAWEDNHLVGCVRVLSDLYFRSVIYDLAVLPEYQKRGIGTELVQRCINMCPGSEWLVQTDCAKEFYETIGFKKNSEDDFSMIPCKWF